jgi:hypothetical protein
MDFTDAQWAVLEPLFFRNARTIGVVGRGTIRERC